MATVAIPATDADARNRAIPATTATAVASDIIGPQQLENELAALAELPGIQVWQVGRSYKGGRVTWSM
ncbi:MAG: hypothetical protein R2867_15295 [Caldilineaceae bacterium]